MISHYKKVKAVVDSSFWININRVDLVNILNDYFELIFTKKVEEELLITKKMFYIPKDIIKYNELKNKKLITIQNPKQIDRDLWNRLSKDSGEMQCIALAKEINAVVLIDNGAAIEYCKKNKIMLINSINFIIYYYYLDKITFDQAIQKINVLSPFIKKKYVEKEIILLNKIKGVKDGKRK
jgi:predicted nucleic acid-binding protein